ncbi:MAG: aminotransferase class V-fold PLP-dependent enzyme, partial [Proteobacteria bacterium]|nr:aminotransferase class V-fold PLP-dependent enzyme [Pseudomonadota bacterium]
MSAYFDYNATTMVDEEVMAAMQPYWRDCYANAA